METYIKPGVRVANSKSLGSIIAETIFIFIYIFNIFILFLIVMIEVTKGEGDKNVYVD
jgi:hypothetical protein